MRNVRSLGFVFLVLFLSSGCLVKRYCFTTKDCPENYQCIEGKCLEPLQDARVLQDGLAGITCPKSDMVNIANLFCMDKYEASRPDATLTAEGTSSEYAVSKKAVIPWQNVDLPTARAACKAAGKYLCKLEDWITACEGSQHTIYSYGNAYDPQICNSIDTYCFCDQGACASKKPCPYPHCFGTCGGDIKIDPTGSRSKCKNSWGAFDINGNVWELTDTDDGKEHFRGGAYNCQNSEALHRCDHDGDWGPSARGFRCCADGIPEKTDANILKDAPPPLGRQSVGDLLDTHAICSLPIFPHACGNIPKLPHTQAICSSRRSLPSNKSVLTHATCIMR